MPYRKHEIVANEYYHIYNRGNNRQKIFLEQKNYFYFYKKIKNTFEDKIDLICYCFMPNHYHLIVISKEDEAIPKAMQKIATGYSRAINNAYQKSGHLFEGVYKNKLIPNNEYLLHLIRYIHLNPVRAKLVEMPADWEFSSYKVFANLEKNDFIKHEIITEQIPDYAEFVNSYQEDQYLYIKDLM